MHQGYVGVGESKALKMLISHLRLGRKLGHWKEFLCSLCGFVLLTLLYITSGKCFYVF